MIPGKPKKRFDLFGLKWTSRQKGIFERELGREPELMRTKREARQLLEKKKQDLEGKLTNLDTQRNILLSRMKQKMINKESANLWKDEIRKDEISLKRKIRVLESNIQEFE